MQTQQARSLLSAFPAGSAPRRPTGAEPAASGSDAAPDEAARSRLRVRKAAPSVCPRASAVAPSPRPSRLIRLWVLGVAIMSPAPELSTYTTSSAQGAQHTAQARCHHPLIAITPRSEAH